jgi:hypothetical protein
MSTSSDCLPIRGQRPYLHSRLLIYALYHLANIYFQNFTYPSGALDVAGQVDNGPISQFGWPDQV